MPAAHPPHYQASFWSTRLRDSSRRFFSTPDELREAAAQYFDWCEANPLEEEQLFHYQGSVSSESLTKMRAFTWTGLASFLGISNGTLQAYRSREEFATLMEIVADIIYTQKFEGAAAGLLNANIVSRDLGLADRNELSGVNGGPLAVETIVQYQLPSNGRDEAPEFYQPPEEDE